MLYNWNLLKKFINISDDISNIQQNLTLRSCEVEEIISRKIPKDVVIWKAIEVQRHPEADRLFVCQVDCWDKGKYQIVTWGENLYEFWKKTDNDSEKQLNIKTEENPLYLPIALPGCYLPEIDMTIEKRKMRWIDSAGMICSKSELGIKLDTEKHRIWILNEDFKDLSDKDLSVPLVEKYSFLDNFVIDVDNKTLTHRPDMTWHFGLAVELAWIYSDTDKIKYSKLNQIIQSWQNTDIFQTLNLSNKAQRNLKIKSDNVRSYIMLEINWVQIKESDFFLGSYVSDLQQGLVNNWVDFSNLFMNYSWNPIHFFDSDKIKWDLVVRNAESWELFTDLNKKEHILQSTDLVIADNEKVLALAGVIWWFESQIDKNTKNITVEIANFDPVCVRKTWTALGLRTDAELRFEKNISPVFTLYSLLLFLDELEIFEQSLWDFTIGGLQYYIGSDIQELMNKQVEVDLSEIQKFTFGERRHWFTEQAKKILESIWFKFIDDNRIKVPLRRSPSDINIAQDIYEEVVRIYGYENIQEKPLRWDIQDNGRWDETFLQRSLENVLVNLGFVHVETYPWIDISVIEKFEKSTKKLVKLKNPVASEYENLRDSIFYNMLDVLQKNFRSFDDISIFDIWKTWHLDNWFPQEVKKLNITKYTNSPGYWQQDGILLLKWVLSQILDELKISGKLDFQPTEDNRFHPQKQWQIILDGTNIWNIAELHPIYYDFYKFPEKAQICYVEIDLDYLLKNYILSDKSSEIVDYETVNDNFVWKDLSFLIQKKDLFGKVEDALLKTENVIDLKVFDIYEWENIPENKKSISVSIKIDWRWLDSQQVDKIMRNAIKSVESVWWELRG